MVLPGICQGQVGGAKGGWVGVGQGKVVFKVQELGQRVRGAGGPPHRAGGSGTCAGALVL